MSLAEANYTPWIIVLTQAFYFLVFHNLANLPMGDNRFRGAPAVLDAAQRGHIHSVRVDSTSCSVWC